MNRIKVFSIIFLMVGVQILLLSILVFFFTSNFFQFISFTFGSGLISDLIIFIILSLIAGGIFIFTFNYFDKIDDYFTYNFTQSNSRKLRYLISTCLIFCLDLIFFIGFIIFTKILLDNSILNIFLFMISLVLLVLGIFTYLLYRLNKKDSILQRLKEIKNETRCKNYSEAFNLLFNLYEEKKDSFRKMEKKYEEK
ncbi:MAG: hypothetical protein ACFFAO_10225 [Candidatus Hermodarchaeota archaeon]